MHLVDIEIPSGPAAVLAAEVSAQFSPPLMVNHCLRAYAFSVALAADEYIPVDHELLYVSAMLHDLGLEPAFDNVSQPFENAGGNVAWVFTAGLGWPPARRQRASDIIVAHMLDVDPADEPEGYLLAAATSLDISGIDPHRWSPELIGEVLAKYPRLDLAPRFTACFADQARRKPDSTAGVSTRSGLADRMVNNPLQNWG